MAAQVGLSLTRALLLGNKSSSLRRTASSWSRLQRMNPSPLSLSPQCCFKHTSPVSSAPADQASTTASVTPAVANTRRRRQDDESESPGYVIPFDQDMVDELLLEAKDDMPLSDMPDPFEKNYRRCFLCRHDVQLNHKNVRLLSQFVSPYTGRIYGRAVTGLCIPMQKEVARLIKRSRLSGFMPFVIKDPKYLQDPLPYAPMRKF